MDYEAVEKYRKMTKEERMRLLQELEAREMEKMKK